jgi:hypothetical protein
VYTKSPKLDTTVDLISEQQHNTISEWFIYAPKGMPTGNYISQF